MEQKMKKDTVIERLDRVMDDLRNGRLTEFKDSEEI